MWNFILNKQTRTCAFPCKVTSAVLDILYRCHRRIQDAKLLTPGDIGIEWASRKCVHLLLGGEYLVVLGMYYQVHVVLYWRRIMSWNFCWRRIRRHGHKRQQNFYDFRTQNNEESLRVLWNLDFYSKKQAKGLRGRNICRAKCYTLFLSKGRRAKAVGKPMKWLEVD